MELLKTVPILAELLTHPIYRATICGFEGRIEELMANVEAGLDSLDESHKESGKVRGENAGLSKACEALKAELSEVKGEDF